MNALTGLSERFKRLPKDVVGIDLDSDETRLVRLKRSANGAPALVAAETLPAIASDTDAIEPLALPSTLRGRQACIALAAPRSVVKLLTFPGLFRDDQIDRLVEGLGVEDPESYRIAYKVISEGHGRVESRVLVVGTPEGEAAVGAELFPSGLPVPHSVEVSGLAAMTAFLHGPLAEDPDTSMAVLNSGGHMSTVALFNRGTLSLVRRLSFGSLTLLESIQSALGVDADTAREITADGAFDISQSVSSVLGPFVKQLTVSRDFVERRENCTVQRLLVSGSLADSNDVMRTIETSLEMDVSSFNPFSSLQQGVDGVPPSIQGKESKFAAAVGAALGAFEES